MLNSDRRKRPNPVEQRSTCLGSTVQNLSRCVVEALEPGTWRSLTGMVSGASSLGTLPLGVPEEVTPGAGVAGAMSPPVALQKVSSSKTAEFG